MQLAELYKTNWNNNNNTTGNKIPGNRAKKKSYTTLLLSYLYSEHPLQSQPSESAGKPQSLAEKATKQKTSDFCSLPVPVKKTKLFSSTDQALVALLTPQQSEFAKLIIKST